MNRKVGLIALVTFVSSVVLGQDVTSLTIRVLQSRAMR